MATKQQQATVATIRLRFVVFVAPRLVPSQELPLKTRGSNLSVQRCCWSVGQSARQICGWEVWPAGTTLGAVWSCDQMLRRCWQKLGDGSGQTRCYSLVSIGMVHLRGGTRQHDE